MRVHVFEFICGGGLAGLPLPAALAREADLMLTALVGDLLQLPGLQVSYARDARLPPPADARLRAARVCWRQPDVAASDALAREIAAADATWPIAPETGGALERAAQAVLDAGRVLLGPRPHAIGLAASKFATSQRLARAGIDTVPCFRAGSAWTGSDGPWVVKPDDGAGCVDTRRVGGCEQAAAALGERAGLIAQPWIAGEAMSLCVLATRAGVDVLSVNRQHLRLDDDGAIGLAAVDVNCEPVAAPLAAMADSVAAAIPGLHGYFGIDFVHTTAGPVVIEVNPRLTSSYAGLGPALGLNPAASVLAAATGRPPLPKRPRRGRTIRLRLNGHETG